MILPKPLGQVEGVRGQHFQEWQKSGVDEALSTLNLFSLDGQNAADSLRYALPISERRNDGRLRDQWIKRYEFAEKGGWFCPTLNLEEGRIDEWGCFKADHPRTGGGFGKKQKVIKYEHPVQTPTKVFFLQIPLETWKKVSLRSGVAMPSDIAAGDVERSLTFWKWVKENPQIPRTLCEGVKKAGALLSHGVVAIALPGINMACTKGTNQLKPELKPFIKNTNVNICFDSDVKQKTRENVAKAIKKLGGICTSSGATVSVHEWDSNLGKGIDDVLVSQPLETFERIISQPIAFQTWKTKQLSKLTWEPSMLVNERYLSYFPLPENRIIGLKSPKGTGKSVLLRKWGDEITKNGERILLLTHRVRLGESLAHQFGIPFAGEFRDTTEGSYYGLGLCVDSLHQHSQVQFDVEDWRNFTVIIDEVAQFLRHLLNSGTLKKNRVQILKNLREVLRRANRVIIADADLTDAEINLIYRLLGEETEKGMMGINVHHRTTPRTEKTMMGIECPSQKEEETEKAMVGILCRPQRGKESEKAMVAIQWRPQREEESEKAMVDINTDHREVLPETSGRYLVPTTKNLGSYFEHPFIVINQYRDKSTSYDCFHYEDKNPHHLVAAIEKHIENGGKPFVSVTGQKKTSKFGTQVLEAYFKKKFPGLKILRIDSESVGDPSNPAYGCMNNLNAVLKNYDMTIASPAVETGVSIDIQNHFTAVFGIYQGVQTVESVCQALARVREPIPRHVWVNKIGASKVGNGGTTINDLLAGQHKTTSAILASLARADFDEIEEKPSSNYFTYWGIKGALQNLGMADYRNQVLDRLREEGQTILSPLETLNSESVKEEIKQTKEEGYSEYCEGVASQESPSESYYQYLESKNTKTQVERLIEKKGTLERKYEGIEVTPELVRKDDAGWGSKIRLHYDLTKGREFIKDKDLNLVEKARENGGIWKPDFNQRAKSAKVQFLEFLKIPQLLEESEFSEIHPLVQEILEISRNNTWEIKTVLGLTISKRTKPMRFIKELLGKIGFETVQFKQTTIEGRRLKVFSKPAHDFERDDNNRVVKDSNGLPIPINDERATIFENWYQRDLDKVNGQSSVFDLHRRANKDNYIISSTVQLNSTVQELESPIDKTLEHFPIDLDVSGHRVVVDDGNGEIEGVVWRWNSDTFEGTFWYPDGAGGTVPLPMEIPYGGIEVKVLKTSGVGDCPAEFNAEKLNFQGQPITVENVKKRRQRLIKRLSKRID